MLCCCSSSNLKKLLSHEGLLAQQQGHCSWYKVSQCITAAMAYTTEPHKGAGYAWSKAKRSLLLDAGSSCGVFVQAHRGCCRRCNDMSRACVSRHAPRVHLRNLPLVGSTISIQRDCHAAIVAVLVGKGQASTKGDLRHMGRLATSSRTRLRGCMQAAVQAGTEITGRRMCAALQQHAGRKQVASKLGSAGSWSKTRQGLKLTWSPTIPSPP